MERNRAMVHEDEMPIWQKKGYSSEEEFYEFDGIPFIGEGLLVFILTLVAIAAIPTIIILSHILKSR